MQDIYTLFEFSRDADISSWTVVNDGVMGGLSKGQFSINEEGHGLFRGSVSLENNGGFSLVQYRLTALDTKKYNSLVVRLKGDGKNYQVRLKTNASDYFNYAVNIKTNGNWETITIPFEKMIPQFRGRLLNMPSFPGEQIEEVAFLIGNKKAEEFKLEIDKIVLK
ncbi:MAG: CIA30 family protein [Eudoraea sp.]|nr:CIA30 family protein [Eudoraea sp.]